MVLRVLLVSVDVCALALSWVPALAGSSWSLAASLPVIDRPDGRLALMIVATTVLCVVVMASRRLYLARVCSTRAVEVAGLFRVAGVSALIGAVGVWVIGGHPNLPGALVHWALAFVLLSLGRSLYRGWLLFQRRNGRYVRPLVIVGANDDGLAWCRLLQAHPELGLQVCGVVGEARAARQFDVAWLGDVAEAGTAVRSTGATGATVVATALEPDQLNRVVRELLGSGIHVQVSNGLRGIAHHRFGLTSVARESLFYVEQQTLSQWQVRAKRAMDLVLASVLLVVSLPLLALSALAVKIQDGGPVLFRQQRVGTHGQLFTLFKMRTMVVDAESQLAMLAERNQRHGPLFKLARDPRVTWVGRVLRATSIDELPQLLDVFQGHMSIVGPRPALPEEVAQFDQELLARQDVLPGITGLWQLEARDDPSFDSYQRLDLHYVENWSIVLDMAIIVSTAASVFARSVRILWAAGRRAFSSGEAEEKADAVPVPDPLPVLD